MIDPRLRHWIIIIVVVVWALNFVLGVIPQANYEADQAINLIFMTIVGSLFVIPKRPDSKELDSKEEDKSPERNGAGNGGAADG